MSLAKAGEDEGNWDFALAPFYLWAVSLDGDVTAGGQEGQVSADFGDVFSNLEAVFIVHFETVYKKKYGFLLDINYINMGGSQSTPITSINVDLTATVVESALYYRWYHGEHTFDLMAGILVTGVEQEIEVVGLPNRIGLDESWVDPMIFVRWNWDFAEKWGLVLKGGIGGFGVSSEFAWEGLGLVTFQPWKHAEFLVGYRAVGVDYETGSGVSRFVYDVTMAGPVIGLNFKW